MKSALCFALLAALAVCTLGGVGAVKATPGEVLSLDADNLAGAIKKHPFLVVEFYAPWCGHCKRLEPEWATAAETLASSEGFSPPIVLAKLDATDEKNTELAKEHDIKGFPTIKVFREGATKGEDYSGPRVAKGIVSTLEKLAGPATFALFTAKDVEEFVEKAPVVMLAVFKAQGDKELKVYESAARAMKSGGGGLDLNFGYVLDAELLPGVASDAAAPAVYMYKMFDERVVPFEMDLTVANLKLFVESRSLPLVAELDKKPESRNILRRLFKFRAPKVLSFVDYKNEVQRAEIKAALTEAAARGETEYKFVIGDATENEGAIKFFGVSPDMLPAVVLHDTNADKKYVLQPAVPSEIGAWLDKFKAGSLEASIKSEEPPKNNLGSVKVVVAQTFEEIVTGNSGKADVLLELYAPWCGHCKKLAPIYEKVGEAFSSDASVTIAKMDATANDVPDARFVVKGFPSLYFYKADTDKVVAYVGDRSESDLIKFVKSHARKTRDEL